MDRMILMGKQFVGRLLTEDYFGLAAQLAYFFLLSLFPLLLFMITLIGYLPFDEHLLTDMLATVAPAESMDFITSNINSLVNQQNGSLLSISILGTLWSASNGVNAIMKAFNRAYDVQEDRSFFISRLIAIVLTIAMIGIIVIAIVLPVLGKMIGIYIFSFFGLSDDFVQAWGTLRWGVTSIVFCIVFLFLYKLAPNIRISFKDAFGGAVFATICWQLVSYAFSYYVHTIGNYSATYGSLGAVIILMVWFYLSGIIIISGGILNAVYLDTKKK